MADEAKLSTQQKRAIMAGTRGQNLSQATVTRKAEQSLADEKEHKVYRNWANWILKGAGIDVVMQDFATDLTDGVILNRMVEAFSGRSQKYTKNCANEFQKIDNINLALAWFKRKGVVTTVASQDFVNGNLRPVLAFFWMLIQKYQLVSNQSMSFTPSDNEGSIYDWVSNYVRDYPGMGDVQLGSPQDFRDGKVLNYMVHKNVPSVIPLENLDRETPQVRLERAIDEAYNKLGVPMLMEAKDLLETNPHEPTLLTYLYAFKATVENEKHLAKVAADREQADRERQALHDREANAARLAEQAAREKAALERERQRLLDEEARRKAEQDRLAAEKAAAEEERRRREAEHAAELDRLRKEKEAAERARQAAAADRAAQDLEQDRLRKQLEDMKRLQAERDRAMKDLEELERQRKQAEADRLAAERARRDAEQSAADADDDAKRLLKKLQDELAALRAAQAEEEKRRREMEAARAAAEREAERLRREAEEEARRRAEEEARRLAAEKRAKDAERDAADRDARNRAAMENLRNQMSQVTPAEAGMDCAACHIKLSGLVVRVNGSTLYHEKCFVCRTCSKTFDQFYFPHNGTPYCQKHYMEAADFKCAKCFDFIGEDKAVVARGSKYHARCFVCSDSSCGRPFHEAFYMRNNQPYCDQHYNRKN